jgi:hypothetical protein
MSNSSAKTSLVNPAINDVIDSIKTTITEDGFYSVAEFKELVQTTGINAEELLMYLQHEGILYVKTIAANQELEQEVLIDIRPLAAAMLLAYSERGFALKNSVYKFVEKLYQLGNWEWAYTILYMQPLLKDMYEQYGHNFTVSEVAEAADLSNEDERLIGERAKRHISIMSELMKSDAELTAVYQLARRTIDIVNGHVINDHKASRKDLQYRNFTKPVAYNRFWTLAQDIIDRHYKK